MSAVRSVRTYSLQILVIACLAIGIIFLTYRFGVEYPHEMAAVEEHQKRELESLATGLNQSLSQLHSIVRDWAHWDDTYGFIQRPTQHQDYVEGNLVPGTFEGFNLVGMGYFDGDLKPVLVRGFDLAEGTWASFDRVLTQPLTNLLAANSESLPAQHTNGWMMTKYGPAEFALDYITTSEGDQVPAGYLLFIRLIDDAQLDTLRAITRLGLELEPVEPGHEATGIPRLGSDNTYEGFRQVRQRVLADPSGNPVAILTITHNPIVIPISMGWDEVLFLLGLILVPMVVMCFVDRVLLQALREASENIEEMVHEKTMKPLPQKFRARELEQIRQAFNRLIALLQTQQSRLTELSRTDALTGIPNRRAFDWNADSAWRQARRSHQSFLLASLDLDYFKPYNDQLGHPRGDEALRKVGRALEGWTRRSGDFCARLGGEEFAVVLLGLSEDESRRQIEGLCQTIEELDIYHPGSEVAATLTASVGAVFVAEPKGADSDTSLADLVSLADEGLYRAKHEGRNRVDFRVIDA